MIQPLASDYRVEIDVGDAAAWYEQVKAFSDASLYQLWQEAAGPGHLTGVSRMALRSGSDIVAAAEVRLLRLPLMQRGIAYVLWGPLSRRSPEGSPAVFRQAVRALRNEYVIRRRMVLRVNPRLVTEQDQACLKVLSDEGFSPVRYLMKGQSLIVDLSPELDSLRRDLDKKWRNCLSKAERSGLSITSGTGLDLFDDFAGIYNRMLRRKQFEPSADIQKHRQIQQLLPEELKMRILIASHDGRPCAGAIYSALGDTAVYLFGATDDEGMRTSGSYLVQWEVLKTLKANGVRRYDLNGVDASRNPGTYHFKRGLAGKNGTAVTFAGQFQAADTSIANYSLLLLDRARHAVRAARVRRASTAVKAQ